MILPEMLEAMQSNPQATQILGLWGKRDGHADP